MFLNTEVPGSLYVTLMKRYLNERASMLVNCLPGSEASNYEYVEKYLMDIISIVSAIFSGVI